MKKQKRFLSVLGGMLVIAAVLCMAGCQIEAPDAPERTALQKEDNKPAPWEGGEIKGNDFADDRVVVVLSKEASLNFRTYRPEDFPETKFIRVDDSTKLTMELVIKQLEAEKTGNWSELKEHVDNNMLVKVEDFRRILDLILPEEDRSREKVKEAISRFKGREDIEYAGPDYFMEIAAVPNPLPTYYNSYQLAPLTYTHLPQAWDIVTGSPSVKVAVIDSGIDAGHPALTNRIDKSASRDYIEDNAPPNVIVVNPNGFANLTSSGYYGVTDFKGHGTHVAGIIGANGTGVSNGNGVIGTTWNVTLVSLRVTNKEGKGHTSATRYAVDYATSAAIPIANYSASSQDDDNLFRAAIKNYPGLFVTSAGNGFDEDDEQGYDIEGRNAPPIYPASYNFSNLISVGALNVDGTARAEFSNWGQTTIDLFAPGTGIISAYPTAKCSNGTHGDEGSIHIANGYHTMSGTSMAAPFVSGVAALLKTMNPNMSASEIKAIILNNTENVTALSTSCVTGGRLNAFGAVQNSRLIGSFDITYTNNSIGVSGIIGRFYLFSNRAWAFVDRGFVPSSSYIPDKMATYPFAQYLGPATIPDGIKSHLNSINGIINEPVRVQVPTYDIRAGCHSRQIEVRFIISRDGITITDGTYGYEMYTYIPDQEKVKLLPKSGRLP